jgi:hypothetical protein
VTGVTKDAVEGAAGMIRAQGEIDMRTTIALIALALITPAVSFAAAGTASGTFTVNGKAAKLTHAYAKATTDSSNKEEIEVILSDIPLDAKVLDDPTPFGLIDLSQAGKLHGIKFFIKPPDMVTGTMLFDYPAFKMGSVSAAGSYIKVDVKTLDKTTVAGKLYTTQPLDFNDVPYEYSVTFSAPLVH